MELPENFTLYLMTAPQQAAKAQRFGLPPAHMAYRVGSGPRLLRAQAAPPPQGGVMVADCQGGEGRGSPEAFCQEVVRECAARSFQGAFFDFEGPPQPALRRAVERLAPIFQKRGWRLYLPESYTLSAPAVRVVVPTAISGGSLRQRLGQAVQTYGQGRVALALEWSAEDFTLPAASGSGERLSWEALDSLTGRRAGAVYFSEELCAHYFTYMRTGQSAHFTLFDDPASMAKKLALAAELGIREGFLPDPGRDDYLQALLATTA